MQCIEKLCVSKDGQEWLRSNFDVKGGTVIVCFDELRSLASVIRTHGVCDRSSTANSLSRPDKVLDCLARMCKNARVLAMDADMGCDGVALDFLRRVADQKQMQMVHLTGACRRAAWSWRAP